jgi:hypothetical protein
MCPRISETEALPHLNGATISAPVTRPTERPHCVCSGRWSTGTGKQIERRNPNSRPARSADGRVRCNGNNVDVTHLSAHRIQTGGRFRRAVALLALTAWTLSGFACPMPEHSMGAVQAQHDAPMPGSHVHQHRSPSHPESDLCCELLSNAHAIAQPIATPTPEKACGSSVAAASAAVPSLVPETDPTTRLIPPSNGPPRNLSQRFATFWSHAPPADLS